MDIIVIIKFELYTYKQSDCNKLIKKYTYKVKKNPCTILSTNNHKEIQEVPYGRIYFLNINAIIEIEVIFILKIVSTLIFQITAT